MSIIAQRFSNSHKKILSKRKNTTKKIQQDDVLMLEEMKHCFNFFYDNFSRNQATYGLMPDRVPDVRHKCSIAANGFMLAAMTVGADMKYISVNEAKTICQGTLQTVLNLEQSHGFLYHFYSMDTGERLYHCELSTIDTALLIAGALTAGAYFGGQTLKLARKLANRCDWNYFYDTERKMFRMARYDSGFAVWWDYYAEQLIMYVLAAAGSGANIAREAYDNLGRLHGVTFSGEQFVHTWYGSLFAHQFSHAFVDFGAKVDSFGTDWFANSVKASVNDRDFCQSQPDLYPTGIWGLTSCAVPNGYKGHIGCPPSGNGNTEHISDGTVAPAAALGSIVFTPQSALSALKVFGSYPQLWGKYGLYDSFNLSEKWFVDCYIAIDKGITLLMGANYYKRTVWRHFNSLSEIRKAMKLLGFKDKVSN